MPTVPDELREVLRRLGAGLKALYGDRYRGLVLYGSYARGEAREGSDVDLLLLLEGPVDTTEEIFRTSEITWPLSLEHDLVLTVMPLSTDEYRRAQGPFLKNVHREGVPAI